MIYPFPPLLRHGCDMFFYQGSGDDYTLKRRHFVLKMAKRKDVSNFVSTDDEVELLFRVTNEYKVAKSAENVDWESVHRKSRDHNLLQKCNKILERFKAPNGSRFQKDTVTPVYTTHETVSL